MQEMNDQYKARLDKLSKFKEMGVNPYPHKFNRTHTSELLREKKEELLKSEEKIAFAGRVVRYNRKGKLCFMHLKEFF